MITGYLGNLDHVNVAQNMNHHKSTCCQLSYHTQPVVKNPTARAEDARETGLICRMRRFLGEKMATHNKLWKILKEMGMPDHLTCLLRNLYAGQEATVRNGHGTTDWFQIGKGVHQGCIL